jgi:Flp pilus assembly pilin Flp
MRTFEYAIIAIIIGALVLWGAVTLSRSLTASFANSTNLIENGGR